MKHKIILIMLFALLVSCESKYPIEIKQITSKEFVTIEDNYMNRNAIKDSFRITIPTEYVIKINSQIHNITWYYRVDNKILNPNRIDYQVFNKKNKGEEILRLNFEKSFNEKYDTIIVKEKKHLISKKDAQELLKKYNIKRSLEDLKSKDAIKLTTYDKFREENKHIISDFNKITDSINFTVMKQDGSFFDLGKKINW
jgi:maltodextrin utilization protein YvdJ